MSIRLIEGIADIVGVQVIALDQAPGGSGGFDAGAPKKFVIDPHDSLKGSAEIGARSPSV